jgi:hypothetical protein
MRHSISLIRSKRPRGAANGFSGCRDVNIIRFHIQELDGLGECLLRHLILFEPRHRGRLIFGKIALWLPAARKCDCFVLHEESVYLASGWWTLI